jgi:hypothetical protein
LLELQIFVPAHFEFTVEPAEATEKCRDWEHFFAVSSAFSAVNKKKHFDLTEHHSRPASRRVRPAVGARRNRVMTVPVDYGDVDWLLERLSSFHQEYQHVEREYLELRTLLRDAEADLRAQPEDGDRRLKVYYLKRRLDELEGRYPWIASGKPPEIAFWVPPSG